MGSGEKDTRYPVTPAVTLVEDSHARIRSGLEALEQALRRLHPTDFPKLGSALAPVRDALCEARDRFQGTPTPESLAAFRDDLEAASGLIFDALSRIVDPGEEGAMGALRAMREHARAQARLYPLRSALPPVSALSGPVERVGLTRAVSVLCRLWESGHLLALGARWVGDSSAS